MLFKKMNSQYSHIEFEKIKERLLKQFRYYPEEDIWTCGVTQMENSLLCAAIHKHAICSMRK